LLERETRCLGHRTEREREGGRTIAPHLAFACREKRLEKGGVENAIIAVESLVVG
jgi:hypothetical protein